MKKVSIVSLIALVAIIISSCGSSNNVVNNNGISKRKYNKGFFFNRKSNLKTADAKVKDADFKEDKAIAKVEKVEARKAKRANKKEVAATNENIAVVEVEETTESNVTNYSEEPVRGTSENSTEDAVFTDETEIHTSSARESVSETQSSDRAASSSKNSSRDSGGIGMTILLVFLALIIPPLAVFIFEGVTTRFWIDLVLAIVGIGLGVGLGGLAYLAALAAVVYALLIVLNVI